MIMNFSKKDKGRVLKRVISILLCVILSLGLIGCTKDSNAEKLSSDGTINQTGENVSEGSYKNKTSDIFFGCYGIPYDKYGFHEWTKEFYTSDYFNCTFVNDLTSLGEMKEHNIKVWTSADSAYYAAIEAIKNNSGYEGFQKTFDDLYQKILDTGCEETCLGWYVDEPVRMDAIRLISEYAKKYGKRFFIVHHRGGMESVTSKDMEYITDFGFDYYGNVDTEKDAFDNLSEIMHNVSTPETRHWYIPGIFYPAELLNGSKSDIDARTFFNIRAVEDAYSRLKTEKNPGGIMCFAYDFDSPKEGSQGLVGLKQINDANNGVAQELLDVMQKIGREICTGKSGI